MTRTASLPLDSGRIDVAHPRVKVSVPVELHVEGSESPIRGATSELSLGGCYIETMFPLPKGTTLDLKLQIHTTLLIMASVGDLRSAGGKWDQIYQDALRTGKR